MTDRTETKGGEASGLTRAERSSAGELPLKSYQTILEQEILQAEEELKRPVKGLAVSGLIAGLSVSVGFFLMAVLETLTAGFLSPPIRAILLANALTVGFIIAIMGRTDLFTEYTTLAILPVLTGKAPLRALGRLWGWVYLTNLVGAALLAAFVVAIGPALDVVDRDVLSRLAGPLVDHAWWVIGISAVMTGWLMGLLSWLITAARDTISQIFFVWVVTGTIGIGGLHHAITGSAEVLAAVFAGSAFGAVQFGRFLLWTTAGNAVGGVIFAVLIRYSLVIRRTGRRQQDEDGHPRSG